MALRRSFAPVVVVGAGPAGATAARTLARAGVAVKLIDRSTFPRNKPCGGAVNLRVLHRFPCFEQELERTATHAVSRLALEGPGGDSTIEESDGPAALMIRRVEFDARLVSLAVEAGAELVTGMDIVQASATDGRVSLTGRDGRQVEASVVIAAGACVLPRVRREGAVRATARVGRAVARAGRDGRRIRQAQLHAVPDFRRRAAAQSRPRPGAGGRRWLARRYPRACNDEIGSELRDSVLVQRSLFSSRQRVGRMMKNAHRCPAATRALLEYATGLRSYASVRRRLLTRSLHLALRLMWEGVRPLFPNRLGKD